MKRLTVPLLVAAVASIGFVQITATASPVSHSVPALASAAPKHMLSADNFPRPSREACVSTVAKLPTSTLYKPTDRRLYQHTLVVVRKSKRRLMLFRYGKAVPGCWQVGLGSGKIAGTKHREGDLKTPEGWYRTSDKPWSRFHGAIAIHYPNKLDARRGLRSGQISRSTYRRIVRALERGVKPPQRTKLGGEVLIHGGGGKSDWTLGCVALDNPRLDSLRKLLPRNKRFNILILP